MPKKSCSLSVVLAVFNEEKNLAQCLDSVQGIADEIVIVDGGSTDQTPLIAKKYGAKLSKTSNKLNFHINKQLAINKATSDLVLQLDADEILDTELQTFIKDLKLKLSQPTYRQTRQAPIAWYLRRKNLFLGQYLTKGGQYPDPVIRLFIAGKARLPQQSVHEQMIVKGPIATAAGHLLHHSTPVWADYWRKFQTYTEFSAVTLLSDHDAYSPSTAFDWIFIKPVVTFLMITVRHKGFVDGWRGWLFGLMSGLHFPFAYIKFLKIKR